MRTQHISSLLVAILSLAIEKASLAQDSVNVSLISQRYVTGGFVGEIEQGDLVYCLRYLAGVVPSREGGQLVIYDISNSELPEERGLGFLPLMRPRSLSLDLPHIAINSDSAVCVCDVNDPWNQRLELILPQDHGVTAIALRSPYLYVVGMDSILRSYDLTDPAQPQLASQSPLSARYKQAEIQDSLLILTGDNLVFYNITNAAHPDSISSISMPTNDFKLLDNYLYLAAGDNGLITYRLDNSLRAERLSQLSITAMNISNRPSAEGPFQLLASLRQRVVHVNPDVWYEYQDLVRIDIRHLEAPSILGYISPPNSGRAWPRACAGISNVASFLQSGFEFLVYNEAGNCNYIHYNENDERSIGLSGGNLIISQEYDQQATNRLITYDASVPRNPRLLQSMRVPLYSKIIGSTDGYLYCLESPNLSWYPLNNNVPSNNAGHLNVAGLQLSQSVLSDDYLYLCSHFDFNNHGRNGYLSIVDLRNAREPSLCCSLAFAVPIYSSALDTANQVLYLAQRDSGIAIVDVSNPRDPRVAGSVCGGQSLYNLCIKGHYLYTGLYDLLILDISDPYHPDSIGCIDLDGWIWGMAVQGKLLAVEEAPIDLELSDTASITMRFYDILDPTRPIQTGLYQSYWYYRDLKLRGQYLFASSSTEIGIFDISRVLYTSPSSSDFHPSTFHLSPVYPNPFNSSTTISFSLPSTGLPPGSRGGLWGGSLRVYDLTGRLVADLTPKGRLAAGEHRVVWDAKDLTSGVYLVRLKGEEWTSSRKVVLLR